jgi:hypothetical protein
MNASNSYNRTNALIYELIIFIERFFSGLKNNKFLQLVKANCQDDWAEFRTLIVMEELDIQIKKINTSWEQEDKQNSAAAFSEAPPDGSRAQELLGGELRITSPWTHDKPEP